MNVVEFFRTVDLARAVGISVQQVRNYESDGFLPAVERSDTGYRRYRRQHMVALKTARLLIGSYGAPGAQQIMRAVHRGALGDALALMDERHAELARNRIQLVQTEATLRLLAGHLSPDRHARDSAPSRVGAAARLVGVPVSTLRFWEQQGLLHPYRDRESNYRLYDETQLRRLRIVALLRQANYDFDTIRATLHELEEGRPQRAVAAVLQRRRVLARISWHCLEADAALHAYIDEFMDDAIVAIAEATPGNAPPQVDIR